jgi:alcohol dehydrogenase, propanol-preferring
VKAAILSTPAPIASRPLAISEVPAPATAPGQVLLRVRACGVCRTDLHVVEGELKPLRPHVIPGHQIVGEVAGGDLPVGMRVGVTWMAGTDGT